MTELATTLTIYGVSDMKKLGGPVKCPKCGGLNPSGFYNPDCCRWCGKGRINYKRFVDKLIDMKPLDPEYSKVADNHFWELA